MPPIVVTAQGPPTSAGVEFLSKSTRTSESAAHESNLLKAIRAALRGTDADSSHDVKTARFFNNTEGSDYELAWNTTDAVLSFGGVMIKRWSFNSEEEPVQYACLGEIEQTIVPNAGLAPGRQPGEETMRYYGDPVDTGRPIEGPFSRAEKKRARPKEGMYNTKVQCVFVFLRSLGRIYLMNGVDYTFSLPFIVRRAWPVTPHGVMVQRVLEPYEITEAEELGEDVLPTIFSITNPFAEATAVGLTSGIFRSADNAPAYLKDDQEHSKTPLKSIPPMEMIVSASDSNPAAGAQVTVTVDVKKNLLSIWHYVYIKPQSPISPPPDHAKGKGKHRHSMSGVGNRRTSALFDNVPRGRAMSPDGSLDFLEFGGMDDLPLSSLPGMPPSLSTTTTMASLLPVKPEPKAQTQKQAGKKGEKDDQKGEKEKPRARRDSLTRNDLTSNMDRMALGGGGARYDDYFAPPDYGRMKAAYWMERVFTHQIPEEDAKCWRDMTVSLFDDRFDGNVSRCLLAITFPVSKSVHFFTVAHLHNRTMEVRAVTSMPALSVASVRATRLKIWDLLIVKPDGSLSLLIHGLRDVPLQVRQPHEQPKLETTDLDTDMEMWISDDNENHGPIVSTADPRWGTTTVIHADGYKSLITFDIYPHDKLVSECFELISLIFPPEVTFPLHCTFLDLWSARTWSTARTIEYECFSQALCSVFNLPFSPVDQPTDPWSKLAQSSAHYRYSEDPALKGLELPPTTPVPRPDLRDPHPLLAQLLYALHMLAENLRLSLSRHRDLIKFAPLLCRIAVSVRQEWADYWKRLVPDAMSVWPSSLPKPQTVPMDDRMPVWPLDLSAVLYGRIGYPDWKKPWHDVHHIISQFECKGSFQYGMADPFKRLHELSLLYNTLSDPKVPETQKRAEAVVYKLVTKNPGRDITEDLPLGIAAPLREAARTCQLAPPGNWPLNAYRAIGRDDLAASATQAPELFVHDGYKTRKEFINPSKRREEISEIIAQTRLLAGESDPAAQTGVDLNSKEFTDIRFGLDRRLEEVARMLCSSTIPNIKGMDRELSNEHEQAKEYQNHAIRVAERTFALAYGRALFTFGSVPRVNRESFVIPKIEHSFRITPPNILLTPEPGKISPECQQWGEFHNGVAAALRISSSAPNIESSWIKFNKNEDMTAEHAGFLLGLGLTGHLKNLATWHTFSYLAPKHDYTTIGVLLGMSAANVGRASEDMKKLLAVHTPALLPGERSNTDLNVSLIAQAAGIAGGGLLFLGTRNRGMAEIALSQLSRPDLTQPDLSNENREAYTYSCGLAFGMIMLGRGTDIPVDLALINRLSVLIHGEANATRGIDNKSFDLNLTSPAASWALGLMYLRTNRQDVADILYIPDTVVKLNSVQPGFLLIRTVARSLIMWDSVVPSNEWMINQVPLPIRDALHSRQKTGNPIDDSFDLAYYNVIAGCCFVIGLKYAGTARQEAYQLIVKHFDLFSRMAYASGPAFDHKIKRSAIRDGLNLISIALSMVMAGTGEISCLRRLRYAYGMSQQMVYLHALKYGTHVAVHQSLGLLFLGGGRYTLGTSDTAIAVMVAAFFPRYGQVSSDNRSYLQALRHLWVLAVEPRCLIARDVDTNEVVYLPVKIMMKEGDRVEQTQLIAPTLIPDMEKLMSIRVDTPRYWPFYLDLEAHARHREVLLRSQTLYVKRRTAFLSYTEDPRGSRSLFVRSGSSSGDAAILDFPHIMDVKAHPAGDLREFITSFSNNTLFLAFADHFARDTGETAEERIFHAYCHATLLDSILQDKPQTLQSHLTLYKYRNMSPTSRFFHLRLEDLRFAADFYAKVYERRFSGRAENNPRPPLIRDSTVQGALHALDRTLDQIKEMPEFASYMREYVRGSSLPDTVSSVAVTGIGLDGKPMNGDVIGRYLAWYLLRNGVPASSVLVALRQLAREAHAKYLNKPPPEGTPNSQSLDIGIKEVLHATGAKLTTSVGSGWSIRSLNEVIDAWTNG